MKKHILFFDGVCGLCNGVVDFVMERDKEQKFLFSPLQSEYALNHLTQEETANLTSVIIVTSDQHKLSRYQAVKFLLKELPIPYALGGYFMHILPNFLGNILYDLVAKSRYKIFGQKETCRLPSPEEKKRFIL